MLPLEDQPEQAPGRVERRPIVPYVTYGLILLNVFVFIYQLTLTPLDLRAFIETWGLVPTAVAAGNSQAYLTFLTAMFIHGGFLHIFSNMLFLGIFGDNVEEALGHGTFLGLYLVAGILASASQMAAFPQSAVPMIGASGAVAGALAAYLLLFPRAPVRLLIFVGPFVVLGRAAAMLPIGIWFGIQFFQGFLSLGLGDAQAGGVAYIAHVGGFVAGLALTAGIRAARGQPLGTFTRGFLWGPFFRNWLFLVVGLLVLLGLGGLIGNTVSPLIGALVQALALIAAGLAALVDGLARMAGRPSLLGPGRGVGRVLAVFQVLAGLALLMGLLAS